MLILISFWFFGENKLKIESYTPISNLFQQAPGQKRSFSPRVKIAATEVVVDREAGESDTDDGEGNDGEDNDNNVHTTATQNWKKWQWT